MSWFDVFRPLVGQPIAITVKPRASKNSIVLLSGVIIVFTTAPAEKNLANKAVVTLFKKQFGVKVVIQKGLKSRNKIIVIQL